MKARHRVERLVALLRLQEVVRAKAGEVPLQGLGHLAEMPSGVFYPRNDFCNTGLIQPSAETRYRRERGEAPQVRELALELFGHLLDQQVAEGDAAQPLL